MKKRKGFTLIELVIVIGILAVLAVVSIRAFSGQGEGARNSQHLGYISQIEAASTEYMSEYGIGGAGGLGEFKIVDETHPIVQLGFTKAAVNPWESTAETWKGYEYYVGVVNTKKEVGGVTKDVPKTIVVLSEGKPEVAATTDATVGEVVTLTTALNYLQMLDNVPTVKAGAVDEQIENIAVAP